MPNPNIMAILARFEGCQTASMVYCFNMAHDYPRLRQEYEAYAYTILEMKGHPMTQDEQEKTERSRQYEPDGSVKPARDTGWRVGMPWKDFVPSNQ
jgi:hypothetical protein